MDSKTILKSNILDIIFDNRNKAYGAYVLRKDYNSHVVKSLLIMFSIVLVLAVLQAFKRDSVQILPIVPKIVDVITQPQPIWEQKPLAAQTSRGSNSSTHPPVILNDPLVPDKPNDPQPNNSNNNTGPAGPSTPADSTGVAVPVTPVDPVKPDPITPTGPYGFVEVMPEYPGGMNALIKFLKRNLKTPQDMDENQVADVRVKFVVNTDGSLTGFEVTQTGGEDFDKEVLRVLNKMPKWIPGKTHGENVRVYYTVPVKFTASGD
jgi:periplasmic protein TonB